MTGRRIVAVARRIAQGFRRDHRTLGLIFVVPIVVTGLLGWIITDQDVGSTRILVVDEAGIGGAQVADALRAAVTELGPDLGASLVEPDPAPETLDGATEAIRTDLADVAVVVPADFLTGVVSGERPTIVVVTAGVDPVADAGHLQVVGQLVETAAAASPVGGVVPRIERQTAFLDPDADELDVLAPALLAFFGYFFVFMLTGISFLRERLGGTLERLLATPIRRPEIVLGYSLGFGFFATLQVLLLTAWMLLGIEVPSIGPLPAFTIGLDVQSAGSPGLIFAIVLLLALGAVNLGIFVSTFARTELQVIQFIPVVIVPQALLSGIIWPVDRLPDVLAAIARLLPLTYAVDGLRRVMLEGAGLASAAVQVDLAVLAAVAVLFIVLASRTISRDVA